MPPPWARWFVAAFLAAFVLCGLFGIEAWPLSGFRLFSHLRTDTATSWHAVAVAPDGTEAGVRFGLLPPAYRGSSLLMAGFGSLPEDDRSTLCRTWLAAASDRFGPVIGVRLFRVDHKVIPRDHERPAEPASRTLVFSCGAGGSDA